MFVVQIPKQYRHADVKWDGKIDWVDPEGNQIEEEGFDPEKSKPGFKGLTSFSINYKVSDEVETWLNENCSKWEVVLDELHFEVERDAVLFKTFWC